MKITQLVYETNSAYIPKLRVVFIDWILADVGQVFLWDEIFLSPKVNSIRENESFVRVQNHVVIFRLGFVEVISEFGIYDRFHVLGELIEIRRLPKNCLKMQGKISETEQKSIKNEWERTFSETMKIFEYLRGDYFYRKIVGSLVRSYANITTS